MNIFVKQNLSNNKTCSPYILLKFHSIPYISKQFAYGLKLINNTFTKQDKRLKILITSVGSLVGQNILDVLEYQGFRRRELVELIGMNSIASSPNNFRCDRCYLVPHTNTFDFKKQTQEIIRNEKPNLILSGRDEDTEIISILMRDYPDLPGKIPYGSVNSLKIALNKWETWKFCQQHGLPFAATFFKDQSVNFEDLEAFILKHGYPLIAKPIEGFASKGVFFIRKREDATTIFERDNYIFQEYLGDSASLFNYFDQLDNLTPLFAHAPDVFHHSCHTVIAEDGTFDPIFISRNDHDSGATMGFKKINSPVLEKLTIKFVEAIHGIGGYGPVTVQFRADKNGIWKAQEMNMRTNGNTFPRFLMGQDDLGLIIRILFPEFDFPVYQAPVESREYLIGKSLSCNIMLPAAIGLLNSDRFWSR